MPAEDMPPLGSFVTVVCLLAVTAVASVDAAGTTAIIRDAAVSNAAGPPRKKRFFPDNVLNVPFPLVGAPLLPGYGPAPPVVPVVPPAVPVMPAVAADLLPAYPVVPQPYQSGTRLFPTYPDT